MSTAEVAPWIPPKRSPQILLVGERLVAEYMSWFVNRRAYTRQSDTPGSDGGKHYYFQPKDRVTKERLSLTETTIRRHIAGWWTIGLYAINPETQRSKWVAIDADYQRAHRDLAALQLELEEDGVEAVLEMSRRGAHLWVLCAEPLPAKDCRVYIYNLALRLGVPIRERSARRRELRYFRVRTSLSRVSSGTLFAAAWNPPGEMHRYWFEGAAPDLNSQFAYLRQVKRLTADELATFIEGMSIPDDFLSRSQIDQPMSFQGTGRFQILQHVQPTKERSNNWWAQCPSCAKQGRDQAGDNLAVSVADPRYYKCWAGCTKEMIREALGFPIRVRS